MASLKHTPTLSKDIPMMTDEEKDRRREHFLQKDKAAQAFVLFDLDANMCMGVFSSLGAIVDGLERAFPRYSVIAISSGDGVNTTRIAMKEDYGLKTTEFYFIKFPRRNLVCQSVTR